MVILLLRGWPRCQPSPLLCRTLRQQSVIQITQGELFVANQISRGFMNFDDAPARRCARALHAS